MKTVYYSFILIVSFIAVSSCFAQVDSLSGIVNSYTPVLALYNEQDMNPDSLKIENPDRFSVDDKVLLIQMKGAVPDASTQYQLIDDIKSAGKYEILVTAFVNTTDSLIGFSAPLLNDYDPDEALQLVRVPHHDRIFVEDTIKGAAWDGQTGGVIALIANRTLVLDAPIVADHIGFFGGSPLSEEYNGVCASTNSDYNKLNFTDSAVDSAGLKGEGIYYNGYPYTRGMGRAGNGGGGGNGRYAGGYGGGNIGDGGRGGNEIDSCAPLSRNIQKAKIPSAYYYDKRLYMGGGGGSGTQESAGQATSGGRGGGIVILVADSLTGHQHVISATGESVTDLAGDAGAGGGGAGGVIAGGVDHLLGELTIDIRGGDGGSISQVPCKGLGGGGGGGVFWHAGNALPYSQGIQVETDPGQAGYHPECGNHGATNGGEGDVFSGLFVPLNGFLFNIISGDQTVCQDQLPDSLNATVPKGGTGSYSYTWQQKTNTGNWQTAVSGTSSQQIFHFTSKLNDTTWFRRVVESGAVVDTSGLIVVNVQPKITNDSVFAGQTICYNQQPDTLRGLSLSGGVDVYSYQWQDSVANNDWDSISLSGDASFYQPQVLQDTTFYRRIVYSGVCRAVSNEVTVQVLPPVQNNSFDAPSYYCQGSGKDSIIGSLPRGGDSNHLYRWIERDESLNWDTAFFDHTNKHYVFDSINDTLLFKRVVFSGPANVCKDTSSSAAINWLPSVQNNLISSDTAIVCKNSLTGVPFIGSQPIGGGGSGTFQFLWQEAFDSVQFFDIPGSNIQNLPEDSINTKTYYRRIVQSHTCLDTSNIIVIDTHPLPVVNLLPFDTSVCSQEHVELAMGINVRGQSWQLKYTNGFDVFERQGKTDSLNVMVQPETVDSLQEMAYRINMLKDSTGCYASPGTFDDTVFVTTYGWPVVDAGSDVEACDSFYSLNGSASFGEPFWSLSQGPAGVSFDHQNNYVTRVFVDQADESEYEFNFTVSNHQCQKSDSVSVLFYQPPVPEIREKITLFFKRDTLLEAPVPTEPVNGRWEVWKGHASIHHPQQSITKISGLEPEETIGVRWILERGVCEPVADSMKIIVNDLFTPNGFSPNKDGINDYFFIKGLDHVQENELIVFDRWGHIVFQQAPYQNQWNGKDQNGNSLPEGTYYYILKVQGEMKAEKKGYLILRR